MAMPRVRLDRARSQTSSSVRPCLENSSIPPSRAGIWYPITSPFRRSLYTVPKLTNIVVSRSQVFASTTRIFFNDTIIIITSGHTINHRHRRKA
jgi:hypothetical protein